MEEQIEPKLLSVRGISKYFPGVKALDNVELNLNKGEVLAVIGENGAGKSTLMKILGGVHQPDEGQIFMDGREVIIDSVQTATQLGIAFVHQELNLCENLSIANNVFLGREPRQKFFKLLNKTRLNDDTKEILNRINIKFSPETILKEMTIGAQQMVEIAKALSVQARIIIMDEPTSSLDQNETEQLFKVIKDLKRQGISIIYISHRLGEVKEIADRVLALRDGRNSGTLGHKEINKDNMIKLMVGRNIEEYYRLEHEPSKKVVLEIKDFIVPEHPKCKINFKVYSGEISVLAGLVGAGRTELVHSIFGINDSLGGEVLLEGEPLKINNPCDAIRAGLALVPEDRKAHGLILKNSVEGNVALAGMAGMDCYQKMKIIQFNEIKNITHEMVKALDIRLRDIKQNVDSLSGGNQQKVVLAKWLSLKPKVLLLDEPTRGIDVVAKHEIYRLMEKMAEEGVAILVISSEMHEVLGIADKIIVMHEGKISGELSKKDFCEEAVVRLATGGN